MRLEEDIAFVPGLWPQYWRCDTAFVALPLEVSRPLAMHAPQADDAGASTMLTQACMIAVHLGGAHQVGAGEQQC